MSTHLHGPGQAAAAPGRPCRSANPLILLDFVASRGCLGHLGHPPAPRALAKLVRPIFSCAHYMNKLYQYITFNFLLCESVTTRLATSAFKH